MGNGFYGSFADIDSMFSGSSPKKKKSHKKYVVIKGRAYLIGSKKARSHRRSSSSSGSRSQGKTAFDILTPLAVKGAKKAYGGIKTKFKEIKQKRQNSFDVPSLDKEYT